MKPMDPNRLVFIAERHFRIGEEGEAKAILEGLIATNYLSSKVYELLGYIYGNKGNLDIANRYLERACQLPGHSPESLYYLGVSHLKLCQPQLAVEAFNRSIVLGGASFEAFHDLGTAYAQLGAKRAALESYNKAAKLRPDSFDLQFNIGKVYDDIKDYDNAIRHYDKAIRIDASVADAWAHRGAALYDAKRYVEAITSWERAFSIQPDIDFLFGFLVHARLRLCDWSKWNVERTALTRLITEGRSVCSPFEILAVSGDEALILKAAQRWVAQKFGRRHAAAPYRERPEGDRIRIGYFSADFCNHAVSYLTAELYELHDRSEFEIFAFALDGSRMDNPMRARLVLAFDHFIEVQDRSDIEIANISVSFGIDIAVDLGGHTKGSRTGVFENRAAPIQVNYIGYPGTMGAEFIDYIIADQIVIPEGSEQNYTEKIVYMPDVFQPSDTKKPIDQPKLSRSVFGLPDTGFIFCCFNNSYKINPEMFASWMRILSAAEGSCLWLLADAEQVEENFRGEAARAGVDASRLVFSGRVSLSEYFGRYRWADLFLDTLPFNGGTTANDALWAGLPVLTRPGGSFAGRMATSLLKTLDLPELIVDTEEEYEAAAIRYARNPDALHSVKDKLRWARETAPLFDMPRYTRHLEAAYREMVKRFRAGLPSDHIHVAPLSEKRVAV